LKHEFSNEIQNAKEKNRFRNMQNEIQEFHLVLKLKHVTCWTCRFEKVFSECGIKIFARSSYINQSFDPQENSISLSHFICDLQSHVCREMFDTVMEVIYY